MTFIFLSWYRQRDFNPQFPYLLGRCLGHYAKNRQLTQTGEDTAKGADLSWKWTRVHLSSKNECNFQHVFREIKRLGPIETSLYLFGPEVQECLSPDFDRDRPSHLIRRPVTSGHLNRIASRYGLASSKTSRKQTPVSYPLLELRKKQRFGSD